MSPSVRTCMEAWVQRTQKALCRELEDIDGHAVFSKDTWERPGGGRGLSCVLQQGGVFEKAGVNTSVVYGTLSPEAMAEARAEAGDRSQKGDPQADPHFFAVGLSLVLHPHNPMVPTVHANYRYFERGHGKIPAAWWFGGGADLTPSYLFVEDVQHFHRTHRQACDRHDVSFYPRFKKGCDAYFFIPHRQERRGVGGIFFDDLCDRSPEALLAFVTDCGVALGPAYFPLVHRRQAMPYTAENKVWQQLRRGRYVEFNLLYDRGTRFGLRTGGRIESILMSLPLTARWEYSATPPAGSPEAALVEVLKNPVDWLEKDLPVFLDV